MMGWAELGRAGGGKGKGRRVSIDPGGEVASYLKQRRERDSGGSG